jgi:hypothetical protein
MNLKTIWTLKFNDLIINEGDTIKIYLHNDEILIGDYNFSDESTIYLNRENSEMEIDFDDVKEIVILRR